MDKKLWYYRQHFGFISRTIELRFTKEKNGRLPKTKEL